MDVMVEYVSAAANEPVLHQSIVVFGSKFDVTVPIGKLALIKACLQPNELTIVSIDTPGMKEESQPYEVGSLTVFGGDPQHDWGPTLPGISDGFHGFSGAAPTRVNMEAGMEQRNVEDAWIVGARLEPSAKAPKARATLVLTVQHWPRHALPGSQTFQTVRRLEDEAKAKAQEALRLREQAARARKAEHVRRLRPLLPAHLRGEQDTRMVDGHSRNGGTPTTTYTVGSGSRAVV